MEQINNFKLISSLKANDKVDVKKYTSISSGLNVVIANVPGPLVSGFFTLATEAFDDDGLPHTLEHLIFLGSEDYPYKGVLDLLANRNLASGTNAWTATDHTCYTMTTAGTEGFLNLLPVFVDHILFPTLSDSGYITEVYHVTGEGKDAGVVYCEMQGRENSGESRVHLEMLRAAYPGHCGYKSETGGIMKNLRESTNNVKVREYHKQFYRPENLTLIITGEVDPKEVLDALSGIEAKIASKGSRPTFVRPWQTSVPPLPKSVDMIVPYASDEEDNGMVYVGWRGPSAVTELHSVAACAILLQYLTDSSISPLQKEFIEIADPLASSVGFCIEENFESLLYITFENVPIAKLGEIKPRLDAKLREISSGIEAIDMARLRAVIHRQKLRTLLSLETQPHDSVAFLLIGDMLYGNSNESLDERLNPIRGLDKMSIEDEKFWLGLLDKYIIKGLSVTVRGKPSNEERTKLALEEEMRISDRVESLGPEGLKKYSDALAVAKIDNEKAPPVSVLTATPVPDPTKVNLHKIQLYSTDQPPSAATIDISAFPLYTNIDDIETNFVYLVVLMNTTAVPPNLRLYLPLFLQSILESPILRNGQLISHEAVVAELEQDTIATDTGLGIGESGNFACGRFSQAATLGIQVEPSKYAIGVRWLRELLYSTQFTADRLSIIAAKLVNEVAEFRRKGSKITQDLIKNINYEKGNNNYYVNNMVRQHQFLTALGKDLSENVETAIDDLEKLRAIITDPKNMAIRLSTNLSSLSSKVTDVSEPWRQFLPPGLSPHIQKFSVTKDCEFLQKNASPIANVLGLGCVESSFLNQSVKSIQDYASPDLPPLLVFLQYLTQLEGPMWKQVRGLGLAYGYDMVPRPDESLVYVTLYRSTNLVAAYKEVKNIVDDHLTDGFQYDTVLLDSAKGSMMYEVIKRENTITNSIMQSLFAYFEGVNKNYNRELVEKISQVTSADLHRVGKQYLAPLFDPTKANMSLVCPVGKVKEISSDFTDLGFNVVVCKSLNESFLNC